MRLRPKRNLEVLSISALDLFASALGVFILIAIFLFPFYLRQPSVEADVAGAEAQLEAAGLALEQAKQIAQETADARADAEALRLRAVDELQQARASRSDAKDALLEAASRANETLEEKGALEEEMANLFIDDLDLVFVMDATGSMRDEIEDVQSNLIGIVRILHRLAPSVSAGFVAFKDRDDEYLSRVFPLTPMTGPNLAGLQAFVEGLSAGGGDDYPEPVGQAMLRAIKMPWRDGVQSRIVLIGDAPEHRENWGRVTEMIASFANGRPTGAAPARVSAIFTGRKDEGREFYERVARVGNGDFVTHRGRIMESVLLSVLEPDPSLARRDG